MGGVYLFKQELEPVEGESRTTRGCYRQMRLQATMEAATSDNLVSAVVKDSIITGPRHPRLQPADTP
jgi:hypothetical protein